jgi:hypothetical protein
VASPELRASDLAYVSRWGHAASLIYRLFRRPDPVKTLEEQDKRRNELREGLEWPKKDASPELVVIRLRHHAKYPTPDARVFDIWASPWFKFEVKGITDAHLDIFDSIQSVRIRKGKAKPVAHDDKEGRQVYVVGRIPLETIAYVRWEGDPAYSSPRLYCHYGRRGPFDSVVLFERDGGGHLHELYDITFRPKRFQFLRRFWLNWQMNRHQNEFVKEQ